MDSERSSFISASATSSLILKAQALSTIMNSFLSCFFIYFVSPCLFVYISPPFRPCLLSLQLLKPRLQRVAEGGNNTARRHSGTSGTPTHLTLHFRNLLSESANTLLFPLPPIISSFLGSLLSL
ncbi:hypothetical protein BDQ12DRAFT_691236 [Crucibulum laeve]|uniref:Uncharacterized protein n=1 Tax=Crucibulum laeve TaxID=68775 RepID=A0A5C3LJG3_9AGAR|nr:hypothetical protein BDQ12DRAFT_691236 [Crucibulum laeve]